MEQIVVKSEMQPNGEVMLFYLDENEVQQLDEEKLLSFQNLIQQQDIQQEELLQEETYIYNADDDDEEDIDTSRLDQEYYNQEIWSDEEHRQLLVFYVDNKETFVNGTAKKKRLWEVACQTMITNKSPESCAMRLLFMREAFTKRYIDSMRGVKCNWPFYELCSLAFQDDEYVLNLVEEHKKRDLAPQYPKLKNVRRTKQDGVIITKQVSARTPVDEKVKVMLNLYLDKKLKLGKEQYQKSIWDSIASELGDNEGEYWHRRFLNLRTHYIRLLDKRAQNPDEVINWPYFQDFEKIYENDKEFHRKFNPLYVAETPKVNGNHQATLVTVQETSTEWNDTEITVLVKYYFDCFQEFQDPSIPNKFLWMEVSRLLDKEPSACIEMYEKLKSAYFEKRLREVPDLRCRTPLEILFDNIVAQETEIELIALKKSGISEDNVEMWKAAELDDLVQFIYDHSEVFKDPVLYYICWATVTRKLNKTLASCKHHWEEIVDVYKSIIKDKMSNPEKRVQWRYPVDVFDKIFDYGNNTDLLDGFEQLKINSTAVEAQNQDFQKTGELLDDIDDTKTKRGIGDPKVFKILDYYLKNKEKFLQTSRKQKLWEALSKEVSISATELDHRFRNLKQVYTHYVQREISKPEMPILWPYYAFCKKVFGYRALKNKMKNSKTNKFAKVEWVPKDLKQLITFISKYPDPKSLSVEQFSMLARKLNKTEMDCHEKYVELCKNYRKLKAMKTRNPNSAVFWKYYNVLDEIFSKPELPDTVNGEGDIEMLDYENVENILSQMANYQMSGDSNENTDDDYAIIVIPEGKDFNDAQIIIPGQSMPKTTPPKKKWSKRLKKLLLIHYLNYRKKNKGKIVKWADISAKMPERNASSCKKMFAKLYSSFKNADEDKRKRSPYYDLLMRVLKVKSKLAKTLINNDNNEFEDVELSSDKVMKVLQYYLEHFNEFISPKYEKKLVWIELATTVNEPVTKVFNKVNYLKKMYNSDDRQETEFDDILKEITDKENEFTIFGETDLSTTLEGDSESDIWSDDEVDLLLQWYLSNLDKFKNAKYVRKYLWIEAANMLSKSPLSCSKKMTEVRTTYRNMVKENKEELSQWRFSELCQKIYGTGKKGTVNT